MNGFKDKVRSWFSDDNLKNVRKRIEDGWKSEDRNLTKTLLAVPKALLKALALAIVIVIAVAVFLPVARDWAFAFLIALVPIVLLVRNLFRPAAYYLAGLGTLGILLTVLNLLQVEVHATWLYGALVISALAVTAKLDFKATFIVIAFFVLTVASGALVAFLGGVTNFLGGGLPVDQITHLTWIVLGLMTIGLLWIVADRGAAVAAITIVAAAGFAEFVMGYAGWHLPPLNDDGLAVGINIDQAFYGACLVVVAECLNPGPLRWLWKRIRPLLIAESEAPIKGDWDGDLEGEEVTELIPSGPASARSFILDRLYVLDKQTRVVALDNSRFLSKALRQIRATPEDLEAAGVDVVTYSEYAAQRAIDEIREADAEVSEVIIRKDGTVHSNKLAALGFRKDFIDDHGILPEELLTGTMINEKPEDEEPVPHSSDEDDSGGSAAATTMMTTAAVVATSV
jgi:hypothetical protein